MNEEANVLTDAQDGWSLWKCETYFEVIREHCDKLELLVDNELWTLTKYRELLFTK
jgi:glutamine synthetase